MGIRATIDDIEVPVVEPDFPRVSFSLLDLEDPDKLRGSSSTTFRMPATRDVKRVLGGPGMSETVTNKRPRLRIGNGSQVLYESKVVPVERSAREYSVVAVGDNAEWFELAKNTKLRDIDMGTSDTISDTLMRDSWDDLDTSLYFPLIDFGSFEDRSMIYNVNTNKLRPAIRCWQFLKTAFADWGFSLAVQGSLLGIWKRLVIPNTDGEIAVGESFLYNAGMGCISTTPQGISSVGVDTQVNFDTAPFDPSGTFVLNGRYQAPFTETGALLFHYDLTATIVASFPTPQIMSVRFELFDFTAGTSMANFSLQMSNPGQLALVGTYLFGENFTFNNGSQYGIRVRLSSPATFHALTINSGSFAKFTVVDLEYQEGITVDIAAQAPDMTVMDLLKAISGNRCLVMQTNTAHGEVKVWLDTEFYRGSAVGLDWTTRISHNEPPKKELPLYPVRIEYRWKEDDNDRDLTDMDRLVGGVGYGNYDAEFEDGVKDPLRVELQFAPTAMGWTFDEQVFIPVSRKQDGTYQQDDYDREPRLLVAGGLASGEWTFDGNLESTYPMCYFINPNAPYTLSFGPGTMYGDDKLGTAQVQWAERQRRMMSPVMRADVMIHPDEVWNLDQGIPRLVPDTTGQNMIWIYVQQVIQYTFTQPEYTECVLIPM